MGVPGALWRLWAASTPAIGANCFSCPYLYMVLAPMGGQYAGGDREPRAVCGAGVEQYGEDKKEAREAISSHCRAEQEPRNAREDVPRIAGL